MCSTLSNTKTLMVYLQKQVCKGRSYLKLEQRITQKVQFKKKSVNDVVPAALFLFLLLLFFIVLFIVVKGSFSLFHVGAVLVFVVVGFARILLYFEKMVSLWSFCCKAEAGRVIG